MAKQSYTIGQVLTAAQMTALQANDYNQTVSAKVASYVLVAADAGTRITMSNAAATTITVNTALFTAGDTLIITNIGAGVCTITAGTATVSTGGSLALAQYDSGTLYFTSTGVAIWNGVNPGDITGVTAGTGISGGGTSGTVTVTNSMATAITTNGDVIYGTGSGTFTRLGIGSTSQVLTVTGGVPVWASAAASSGPAFQVHRVTSAQAISSGVDTKLQYNGETFDTDNCFDSTTNYRFTPTKSGYYALNAQANFYFGTANSYTYKIYFNGSSVRTTTTPVTQDNHTNISALIYFNGSTDYAEVYVTPGAATNMDAAPTNQGSYFSGVWIRS